ncbi:MAG: ATP-binding cassette, subfamily bacterial, partial [Actinomycetota bacterium]|nr:ATP-binding cassette, subfamily bacterial [Actinomycetota bacterium]
MPRVTVLIPPRRRSLVITGWHTSRRVSSTGRLSGGRPSLGSVPDPVSPPTERPTNPDTDRADVPPRGWVRRLGLDCWRHRGLTAASVGASTLGVGLESVGPLLVAVAVDRAVRGSTAGLEPIVAGIVALALVKFAMAFLRRYLGGRLSLSVQHDLRRRVFGSISRLDGPRQDALRTGQVVSRANSDLQQVQGLLGMVPYSVGTVAQVVVSVVIMAWLSPVLTVVALITLPVALAFTMVMRRRLFPATWSAQQRAAEVAQGVEETVTGVRVVKGFGQEERETARLATVAGQLYGDRLRAARLTARLTPTLAALPTLGQLVVFALGG